LFCYFAFAFNLLIFCIFAYSNSGPDGPSEDVEALKAVTTEQSRHLKQLQKLCEMQARQLEKRKKKGGLNRSPAGPFPSDVAKVIKEISGGENMIAVFAAGANGLKPHLFVPQSRGIRKINITLFFTMGDMNFYTVITIPTCTICPLGPLPGLLDWIKNIRASSRCFPMEQLWAMLAYIELAFPPGPLRPNVTAGGASEALKAAINGHNGRFSAITGPFFGTVARHIASIAPLIACEIHAPSFEAPKGFLAATSPVFDLNMNNSALRATFPGFFKAIETQHAAWVAGAQAREAKKAQQAASAAAAAASAAAPTGDVSASEDEEDEEEEEGDEE
jgi:hypothetical protein